MSADEAKAEILLRALALRYRQRKPGRVVFTQTEIAEATHLLLTDAFEVDWLGRDLCLTFLGFHGAGREASE